MNDPGILMGGALPKAGGSSVQVSEDMLHLNKIKIEIHLYIILNFIPDQTIKIIFFSVTP